MAKQLTIPITKLVDKTATRARGKEAFSNLLQEIVHIEDRPLTVIIDLSVVPVTTGSFIDELVIRTASISEDVDVVFRLATDNDYRKLRKICSARNIICCYQIGNSGEMKKARRLAANRLEPQEYNGAFFAM